jgi:Carboxypeptidase regulatory-like domain/TonB dependent receptor
MMTTMRLCRISKDWSRGSLFLLFAVLALLQPGTAHGQAGAAVNGTVRDASGGVIPDANVVLHNRSTNLDRNTVTNSAGFYVIPDIQPGEYDLTVSKGGFKTSQREDVTLDVNQTSTIDYTLDPGVVTQTVTVQATVAALETSTSELGVAIVRQEVNNLPLNGRNFTQLLDLTPGVSTINVSQNGSLGGVWSNPIGSFSYPSINGQTNRSDFFLLDGVNNQGSFGSTYAVAPILDDVQEFKVQSHNDDASFGGALGGIINVVTKSGSQQYHGSAWEFYRGAGSDALPTFHPAGSPYQFTQNQFGGAGGGPIDIPWHSSSTPRTFFYTAYEGYRYTQSANALYTTPNVSTELAGDLSSFPNQIYNPYSVVANAASPSGFSNSPFLCTAGLPSPLLGNKTQASGTPCNMIPAGLIDPNMVTYAQKIFPTPNLTGNASFNGVDSTPSNIRQDTGTLRIDHQFSERDNLWARYVGFWQPVTDSGGFVGLPHSQKTDGFNIGVGYSHAFSSSSLFEARFGRVVLTINQNSNPSGAPPSFGPSIFNPNYAGNFRGGAEMVPEVAILGFIGNSNASAHNAAQFDYTKASNIWEGGGAFTKIYQRHTFKMGVDFASNNANAVYLNSGVVFSAANTAAADTAALPPNTVTGNALASFLLGLPNSSTRRNVVETEHGGWVDGAYFMDQWRATAKLTVNLGLRYDLTLMPIYGNNGAANNFVGDLDARHGIYFLERSAPACNPPTVGAPCIPGGVLPANVSLTPLGNGAIFHNDLKNFQPRIGFAYQFAEKTVLRAGYGRFYDNWAAITQTAQNFEGTWPSLDQLGASNTNPITGLPNVFAEDPLSQGNVPPVTGPTPFNQSTWFADPYLKRPYADQWNLGVQQELGTHTVLTANYVGSHGGRLDLGPYANTVNPATGQKPFSFITPTAWDYSGGRSHYNALQVSLNGKQYKGLTYLISYTWSKSVDIGCTGWYGVEGCGIENPYNVNANEGPSAIDLPQIFVASWTYQLPFGTGQQFSSGNKALNYVLGGWGLNGILTLTSGAPFDVGVGGDPALTQNFGCCNGYYDRLNVVSGQSLYASHKGPAGWLNPNAFSTPPTALGSFGDLGRNALRGDNFKNIDLSLFKQFPITERYRIEFRFETFNTFNTPTWGFPDQNIQDKNFNVISSTRNLAARQLQYGIKFYF